MATEFTQTIAKLKKLHTHEIQELKKAHKIAIKKAEKEAVTEALLDYKKKQEAFIEKLTSESPVKPKKIMIAEQTRPPETA